MESSGAEKNLPRPSVAMIQDGARRRYMVPLALQDAGILERVYIDWFVRRRSIESVIAGAAKKINPRLGQKMAERSCPALDPKRVIRNTAMALRLRMKMPKFTSSEESFMWASRETAKWIQRQGFGRANILYGFIRNAAPEAYQAARDLGLKTSGDQIIAPLSVECAEMQEQQRRWPGWSESETANLHQEYQRFEEQTWEKLDQITCMSDYVCDGLTSVGVPAKKIKVIPYPWTENAGTYVERERKSGPLTVGFVGVVGLRKGAPYFLEVAKRFDPARVKFVMVGNVLLAKDKLIPYEKHVEFTGAVPRSQVRDWLRKFDIFFFPSTCEGSAGAVMEAMAGGLPVLTSPNSGSSARHEIDGFVHRHDDVEGFTAAIQRLDDQRDLLKKMGDSARARVLAYDLRAYSKDLSKCFSDLLRGGSEHGVR